MAARSITWKIFVTFDYLRFTTTTQGTRKHIRTLRSKRTANVLMNINLCSMRHQRINKKMFACNKKNLKQRFTFDIQDKGTGVNSTGSLATSHDSPRTPNTKRKKLLLSSCFIGGNPLVLIQCIHKPLPGN